MHYDGGTTHIPQTQHVPHCIPRAKNRKEHRYHPSPQQSLNNTRNHLSRKPAHSRGQLLLTSEDPRVVPRGKRGTTALKTHGTCWNSQGTRTTPRLHIEEGGVLKTFPEDMNIEHKSHKWQDKGKIMPGEDPNARGGGGKGVKGAWILPQLIAAPPRNAEHAPMQYDGGERHTPHTKLVPHCTLRATN